ncbi:GSCOCG00006741001-RA-CDS, partial [Cotesia congregata]
QLPRLRIPQLREELRRRNLRVTGRKPELLARLRAALLVERDHVADDDEENIADLVDDEEEDDFEDARAVNVEGLPGRGNHDVLIRRREESRRLLTFKDVEGALEKFSGDDHTNVQQWLDDFEEMAELIY